MIRSLRFATLLAATPASFVFAHAGHGQPETGNTIRHYVSAPEHLVPVLLLLGASAVAAGLVAILRRRAARQAQAVAIRTNQASAD